MMQPQNISPTTYIIKTNSKEYYCGFTNNFYRRIEEHKKEKKPHWFAFKGRGIKDFILINGNFEKQIKRAGVKMIYMIIKGLHQK